MTDLIYHYCSPHVFLSLISKRQLWLTSLAQSNDNQEGKWMLNSWLDRFDRAKDRNRKFAAQASVELVLSNNFALGACFSEKRDLLSQWRGYATDGMGFSVGFCKRGLDGAISASSLSEMASLVKIQYGSEDLERIKEIIVGLAVAFRYEIENVNSFGAMGFVEIQSQGLNSSKQSAVGNLFTVKNPAFSEEKEWRILLFESLDQTAGVEFRESGNVVSPYFKLDFEPEIIKSVTLGPTNKTGKDMVERALRTYGVKCEVFDSSSSYRSTYLG